MLVLEGDCIARMVLVRWGGGGGVADVPSVVLSQTHVLNGKLSDGATKYVFVVSPLF